MKPMGKVNGDDTIINGDFVPTNPFYIDYDDTNSSYIPFSFSGSDKINEIQKDAEEKMNKIIKIKFEKKRILQKLFNDSDSEEEEEEENKDEMAQSSSMFLSSSSSNSDKSNQKSESIKKNIKSETISPQNSITKKYRADRKVQNVHLNKKIED